MTASKAVTCFFEAPSKKMMTLCENFAPQAFNF